MNSCLCLLFMIKLLLTSESFNTHCLPNTFNFYAIIFVAFRNSVGIIYKICSGKVNYLDYKICTNLLKT
jgi:hypothetical protein